MKKWFLSALLGLSLASMGSLTAFADDHGACEKGCTEKCEKCERKDSKGESCENTECKGCKHGKCPHKKAKGKAAAKAEKPAEKSAESQKAQ